MMQLVEILADAFPDEERRAIFRERTPGVTPEI
jgi:hypothetical protein